MPGSGEGDGALHARVPMARDMAAEVRGTLAAEGPDEVPGFPGGYVDAVAGAGGAVELRDPLPQGAQVLPVTPVHPHPWHPAGMAASHVPDAPHVHRAPGASSHIHLRHLVFVELLGIRAAKGELV